MSILPTSHVPAQRNCPSWCTETQHCTGDNGALLHEHTAVDVVTRDGCMIDQQVRTRVQVEQITGTDQGDQPPTVVLHLDRHPDPVGVDWSTLHGLDPATVRLYAASALSGLWDGAGARLTPAQAVQVGRALVAAGLAAGGIR